MFNPNRPYVPYTFPEISFLKLQDYITNLVNTYGGVYWPLDDVAGSSYNRVINTAVATGRNLATNSGFDSDTFWTKGTGCTIAAGVGHMDGTEAVNTGFTSATGISVQTGRTYKVVYTILNYVSGTCRCICGGNTTGTTRSSNGTFTETLIASGSTTCGISSLSSFIGDIDNLTYQELNIPAYNAVPAQLLNANVWNGLGTGAWAAGNLATLSQQTVTRHDGASGTVLRIQRTTVSNCYAFQSILTVGVPHRVYGWSRGDGSGVGVPFINDNGGLPNTAIGTNSVDWQPFDVVFVPRGTNIQLANSGASGTGYVEFDVTVVALDTGIRQDSNLVLNGNFSVGTNWTLGAGWTISGGVLVATAAGAGIAAVQTGGVVIGKRYLVTYDVVVTSGSVRIALNTALGTTRTVSGTYSEVLICTGASDVRFSPVSTFTGTIDNVIVTELSPLVAVPVNGAVLGNSEAPLRIGTSVSFDGVNDLINLYSAQLNSVFNPAAGSLSVFAKVSASGQWTNGLTKILARISVNTSNEVRIQKSSTNNTIDFIYAAGGTVKTITVGSQSSVGWMHLEITWDTVADQVKAYINGVQVGSTLTGLGVWVGNLSSTACTFGSIDTTGSNPFSGFETQIVLLPVALSTSEVSEISKLGDAS